MVKSSGEVLYNPVGLVIYYVSSSQKTESLNCGSSSESSSRLPMYRYDRYSAFLLMSVFRYECQAKCGSLSYMYVIHQFLILSIWNIQHPQQAEKQTFSTSTRKFSNVSSWTCQGFCSQLAVEEVHFYCYVVNDYLAVKTHFLVDAAHKGCFLTFHKILLFSFSICITQFWIKPDTWPVKENISTATYSES